MFADGNVTLMVQDVPSAVRFYSDVLGFRVLQEDGDDNAEVGGAGLTIRLHKKRREIDLSGSGTAAIGLRVDDLAATAARLAERGVRVGRVIVTGPRSVALFDDPDGNHLYLLERRS